MPPFPVTLAPIDWQRLAPLGYMALYFFIAFVIARLAPWWAKLLLGFSRVTSAKARPSRERQRTLEGLLASGLVVFAFIGALFATLSLYIDSSTLVWMLGLFSAAFGFSARPMVSDILHGVGFLAQNTFDIGEKIEILLPMPPHVQGVVEAVSLRQTLVRAQTGELYTVPNGEIRVIRNFSRGKFSSANVTLWVDTEDLSRALVALEPLRGEAFATLPDLLEAWTVISGSGVAGRKTEVTIVAKASFGKAATLKLQILNLISDRFTREGIALAD